MGFLDNILNNTKTKSFPGQRAGVEQWNNVFGGVTTNKEQNFRQPPVRGGSYGRSITSADASFKRLLQAMRSMAPGGWSDDRWEQTRHWEGIVYVFGHRVCEQAAQSEFQVFVKDENHPDGKRPVSRKDGPHTQEFADKNVKPYDLVELLEKPNNQDSFGELMYRTVQQMTLSGTALEWMVPNVFGVPYEVYTIPTAIAIPQPAVNPDFPDGFYRIQPVYPYGPFSTYPTPASAVGAPIPSQWMVRIQYPHPLLRYDGFSPLTALRLHLDELLMMDKSRHYSMRRSINPSGVVNFEGMEEAQPLREEEIERIHAEWENNFQGPENHGNLIVGTPGSRIEPWGTSPREMDYSSSWDQLTSFCLGGLGITRPAAGMVEDSSYATLFGTLKQLYWLTLEPIVNRVASNLTRHLATAFGNDLIVEIKCKRIDDHEVLNSKLSVMMQGFVLTKNELRKALDMPPTNAAWGNEIAGIPPPPPMMPGMEGQPGAPPQAQSGSELRGANGEPLEQEEQQLLPEEMLPEPSEVANSREGAGVLAEGARGGPGPRKNLDDVQAILKDRMKISTKSLYDQVRDAISTNGNGKH